MLGGVRLPGLTGMDTHSERFTMDCRHGKDCGDGRGEGVEVGMSRGVAGNVTDKFGVAGKTSCIVAPGGDS